MVSCNATKIGREVRGMLSYEEYADVVVKEQEALLLAITIGGHLLESKATDRSDPLVFRANNGP